MNEFLMKYISILLFDTEMTDKDNKKEDDNNIIKSVEILLL
jgi:hypothetical protein